MDAISRAFVLLIIIMTGFSLSSLAGAFEAEPEESMVHSRVMQNDSHFNFPFFQIESEQALGIYWEGHLTSPDHFDNEGEGYIKLFRKRSTGWVTTDLAMIVKDVAKKMANQFQAVDPLQVGDVAGFGGGVLDGHASHQNGLDIDIRLLSKNHHIQEPEKGADFDENFVMKGHASSNFDLERNYQLIKHIVESKRVTFIFLDRVLKSALCRYTKSIGQYESAKTILGHLDHVVSHQDHIHVRITCPQSSPHCQIQDFSLLPPGC